MMTEHFLGEWPQRGFNLVSQLRICEDGQMRLLHWTKCDGGMRPLNRASLYVFVTTGEGHQFLYVGKAGKGWSVRRPQHNGGYKQAQLGKSSVSHQARINDLRERLSRGERIYVYEIEARKAGQLGAEEEALILRLQPLMNIQHGA